MKMNRIDFNKLDESVCEFDHPSGLKIQVIPKKGYYKKFAMFSINYGSIDSRFIVPGDDDVTQVPDGIAHFLEHKLFDQEDGNVLDKFVGMGASPNAFTSFTKTCYHFTCTDNFDDCFKLLMHFVQNPWLTEKSVEKEKGIIGQEINMYKDNAQWVVMMNLLDLMYHNHPIKKEIAGTIESISKISKDILYKCHKTFYHPSNMVVTVVGDIDPQHIADMVDELIETNEKSSDIKRIFDDEPINVSGESKSCKMQVSSPIFQIGFKDYIDNLKGHEKVIHEVAGIILKEILFGSSSELYEELYNRGLVNQTFFSDYDMDTSFAFVCIGGESPDPDEVKNLIIDRITYYNQSGIPISDFNRIKNSCAGKYLKRFNSIEGLGRMFSAAYFQGVDVFDYFDTYGTISFDEVNKVFREIYSVDKMAISSIMPK